MYDKLVVRRRGGWCYELNGLLQQALQEIGFDVRRVAGGVHRHTSGDAAVGNHLVPLVDLDRTYIADLGLGDGLREPVPLAEGVYEQGPFTYRLERLDDGYWRVWNHAGADPEAFDFRDQSGRRGPPRAAVPSPADVRPSRGSSPTWRASRCRSTGSSPSPAGCWRGRRRRARRST